MIADEYAYIGRDNKTRRELLINGNELSSSDKTAITRVTVKIGPYCLDTDVGDNISYSNGIVEMTIGLIENIRKGLYNAEVTVFDGSMTNGKAWGSFTVYVDNWDTCE